MANFQLIEQEIIRGSINGLTFGNARMRVLCRKPDRLLVHIPPHTSYCGRMLGSVSGKGALWRFLRREHGAHGGLEIAEGGRFNLARLLSLRTQIDEAMADDGLVDLLEPDATLVLGESEPFSWTCSEIEHHYSKRDREIIDKAHENQRRLIEGLRVRLNEA